MNGYALVVSAAILAPAVTPRARQAEVVMGNNETAFDLYAKLHGQKGNLFLSPYSISTALAMTYAGARGPTAEEMAKALHFPFDGQQLHAAFAQLAGTLHPPADSKKKPAFRLDVANALWGQKGYTYVPAFLQLTNQYYGAGLRLVDFKSDTETARRTINMWVEDKTEKRIKDLIQPGVLDQSTRLVLTNAIYFKG